SPQHFTDRRGCTGFWWYSHYFSICSHMPKKDIWRERGLPGAPYALAHLSGKSPESRARAAPAPGNV
ncbi:hypothetical protein NDU88_004690, partial [Pleurodeles waltl]